MRAFDAAVGTPWAMLPADLEQLLTIAQRENEITPEVLEAYKLQSASKAESMETRDGIAVLNIVGPLFRRANLFTAFSGATSYDIVRRDLQIALDDDKYKAILLNIDSPGGAANGCDELARAIFDARSAKPVIAYVGGTAASGGYWLASAASEIVVSDSAFLGSIGAVLSITDTSQGEKAAGIRRYDFVSAKSPKKRSDPATRAGEDEFQRIADDLADVFISAVARNRGVSLEKVEADFGEGGMLIGAKAVAAGMADRLGTFEAVMKELSTDARSPGRPSPRSPKGKTMSGTEGPKAGDNNAAPQVTEQQPTPTPTPPITIGAADVKARIKTIMTSSEAKGREDQAAHLAYDTDVSASEAIAILSKGPKAETSAAPVKDDAALHEERRLNAEGLNGGQASGQPAPQATTNVLIATMKKQLGVKETV